MIEPVTISLQGVTAHGRHGVLPAENQLGQRFVVDLELVVLVATDTDELAGTISYADLADMVVEQISGEPVQLLETLAGRIADQVMTDERVERCLVRVHKPQAPIRHHFADVSVSLNRSRAEGRHG